MPGNQQTNAAPLGGAAFTITANTSQFDQALIKSQQSATKFHADVGVAMRGVDASINHAARSSSMALLMLSQGIEDAQYGFRSVVNNIPGIVMALGGGAGLAGAVSILAVGVNQAISHWDELKATFGDTTPFQVAEGAISQLTAAVKTHEKGLKDLAAMAGPLGALGVWGFEHWQGKEADREAARQRALEAEETEKADKAIKGFITPDQRQRAKDFAAVLNEVGGPQKLLDRLMKERGPMNPEIAQGVRDNFARMIFKAMEGGEVKNEFGAGIAGRLEGMRHGRIMKEFEAQGKVEAGIAADLRNQQKKAFEEQRRERIQALQDRREDLMDERHALQEQIRQRPRARIFESGIDYAQAVQTGDQVPRKQLDKLKDMDTKLRDIRDELKKQQRARFGG